MKVDLKDVKKLREMTGAGVVDCKNALVEAEGDVDRAAEILREKGIAKTVKKSGRITAEGLVSSKVEGSKGTMLEVNSETDFVAKNEDFKNFVENMNDLVFNNDPEDIDSLKSMEVENGKDVETTLKELIAKIGENIVLRRFTKLGADNTYVAEYNHGGRIAALVELKANDPSVYTDEEFVQLGKDLAMQITASSPKYVNREDVPEEVVEHEKEVLLNQAINESNENIPADKREMIAHKKVEGRLNKQLFAQVVLVEQDYIKDPDKTVGQLLKEKAAKFEGLEVLDFIRYEVGEGLEKREEDFAEEVSKQMKGE